MSVRNRGHRPFPVGYFLCLLVLAMLAASSPMYAADPSADQEDFDAYKIKLTALWFYAQPSGSFSGTGKNGFFDLQKDLSFNSYSTFSGKVDWKFTRKNHLTFAVTPFDHTRSLVINRTINFQGQTFNVGAAISANLQVNGYAPGYQYDIIRRKRGHLGIQAQLDLFDVQGSLNAAAQITNGLPTVAHKAQGSLRAPLPVFGPNARLYLTKNSNRIFVDGNILGMYFFGYGNFLSTADSLGVTATKHLAIHAGYQLGTRMNINNNASTRIGVNLTQKGPIVGVEVPF